MVHEARGENRQPADCYRKVVEFIEEHPDDYDPGFKDMFTKHPPRKGRPCSTHWRRADTLERVLSRECV